MNNLDWQNIITTILTITIPSILTFLITKRNSEIELHKANNDNTKLQSDVKMLEMQIEQINQNHLNEIDRMKVEYQLKYEEADNFAKLDITRDFFTGNLNIDQMQQNIDKLSLFKQKTDKLNFKQGTSGVSKKRKSK